MWGFRRTTDNSAVENLKLETKVKEIVELAIKNLSEQIASNEREMRDMRTLLDEAKKEEGKLKARVRQQNEADLLFSCLQIVYELLNKKTCDDPRIVTLQEAAILAAQRGASQSLGMALASGVPFSQLLRGQA